MSDAVKGYGPQEALIGPAPTSRVGRFLEGIQRRMREFRENAGPATPEVAKGGAAIIDALIGRAPEAYADAAAGRPLVRKPNAQQSWMRANEPLVDAAGLVPGGGTVAKGAQGVQMGLLPLAAILRKGDLAKDVGLRGVIEQALEANAKGRALPPNVLKAKRVEGQAADDPELLRLYTPDTFNRAAVESALRTEKFDWDKLLPGGDNVTQRIFQELDRVPEASMRDYRDASTAGSAALKDEIDPDLIGLSRGYYQRSKNPVEEALATLAHERQHVLQGALNLDRGQGRLGTNVDNHRLDRMKSMLENYSPQSRAYGPMKDSYDQTLALSEDPWTAAFRAYRRNPGELEARLTEYAARAESDPVIKAQLPREKLVNELQRLTDQSKPYIPGIEERIIEWKRNMPF